MKYRRKGRIAAVQILYQWAVHQQISGQSPCNVDTLCEQFNNCFEILAIPEQDFCRRLVQGVVNHQNSLDDVLKDVTLNWKLHRMGQVERSVLRVAAFEILYCKEIPKAASINEAIEIMKSFGGSGSSGFVNGLLDKLVKPMALTVEDGGLSSQEALLPEELPVSKELAAEDEVEEGDPQLSSLQASSPFSDNYAMVMD